MSADNGVYILRTLKYMNSDNDDDFEYRVTYCIGIDNIYYSDLYLPVYFDGKVMTREEASAEAVRLHKSIEIVTIKLDKFFPNMTREAARMALDTYAGAPKLKAPSEIEVKIEVLGGVAGVTDSGGVCVEIVDHDNLCDEFDK